MKTLQFKMHSDETLLCSVNLARFSEFGWEHSLPVDDFSEKIIRQAKL